MFKQPNQSNKPKTLRDSDRWIYDTKFEHDLTPEWLELLFLERFEKEIVSLHNFQFSSLNPRKRIRIELTETANEQLLGIRHEFRAQVRVGTKQVVKVLASTDNKIKTCKPRLLVLFQPPDVLAANPWNHAASLSKALELPILCFTQRGSQKLSSLLNLRNLSMMVFVQNEESADASTDTSKAFKADLDSFIAYILKKYEDLQRS